MRARNMHFCGEWSEYPDAATGKLVYKGIAKHAWNPMTLDIDENVPVNEQVPRFEDRMTMLARWSPECTLTPTVQQRCVFGVHNSWIDLHTLRQILLFLSPDTRFNPSAQGAHKYEEIRRKRAVRTEREEHAQEIMLERRKNDMKARIQNRKKARRDKQRQKTTMTKK